LGAHPLFFEERPHLSHPVDRIDFAVVDDHPLDYDPTELLTSRRRSHSDRIGQLEDPRAVGVEAADPIVVGERCKGRAN
jgi:hypothetical protein